MSSWVRACDLPLEQAAQLKKLKENRMRKIVVSEAVTVDGVFDAETMGQWAAPYYSNEKDKYIQEIVEAADALLYLYGRTTYELQAPYMSSLKNNEYGIADRLNSMPKYVVSSTPLKAQWNNSTIIKKNVVEEIAKLKRQSGQDILIMGSAILVESLSQTDLIDEYKLLVYPAFMGSGKRFFKDGMGMTKLKLVESKTLSLGTAHFYLSVSLHHSQAARRRTRHRRDSEASAGVSRRAAAHLRRNHGALFRADARRGHRLDPLYHSHPSAAGSGASQQRLELPQQSAVHACGCLARQAHRRGGRFSRAGVLLSGGVRSRAGDGHPDVVGLGQAVAPRLV
jgi:dihydrofolate reductase